MRWNSPASRTSRSTAVTRCVPRLVAGHGVDLVEDHGGHPVQHQAAVRRGEDEVEALRRGDEDLGRVAQHPLPLARTGCRRCA